MDQAHQETVEKDEDGRDRSNYTDNLSETPATSLRTASLREIENVNWVPPWGVDRMATSFAGFSTFGRRVLRWTRWRHSDGLFLDEAISSAVVENC